MISLLDDAMSDIKNEILDMEEIIYELTCIKEEK